MVSKGKYSFLERVNINNLYNAFLGLAPQQQTIAMVAAGVLLFILFMLPFSLASGKIGRMEEDLKGSTKDMEDIVAGIDDYNAKAAEFRALEEGLKAGADKAALSTTIESLAAKAGISENLQGFTNRTTTPYAWFEETSEKSKLAKVSLGQLVDFLYSIEYDKSRPIRVRELDMRTRFDNPQLLDLTFEAATFSKSQKEKE